MSNTRAAKKRAIPEAANASPGSKKMRRNSSEVRRRPNVSPPKTRAILSQLTPRNSRRRSPRNRALARKSRGAAATESNATQGDERPVTTVRSSRRVLHLQNEEMVPRQARVHPITPEITPVKNLILRPGQEDTLEPSPRRSPRTKTALQEQPVRKVPEMIMDSDDEEDEDLAAEDAEREAEMERRDREEKDRFRLMERRARILESDAESLFEEEGSTAMAERGVRELKKHLRAEYCSDSDDGGITEVPGTSVSRHQPGDDLDIDIESTEQPHALGAVTTTNSILQSMFRKLEGVLNARLNTLTSSLVERMDKTDKRFDEVGTQLADIHAIVSRTNTSNKSTDTPLSRFNKLLDKLTPCDGLVVNRDACHRILCSIVPFEVLRTARDNTLAKERVLFRFSTAVQVLLCGKNPRETRKQFREGIGGRHSRFKKNVVLNFIYNVQLNSFGMFADDGEEGEARADQNVIAADAVRETAENPEGRTCKTDTPVDFSCTGKAVSLRQPDWLKKGFILETDIEHARLVQDYSKSEASKRRLKDVESESDSGEEEDGEYTPGPGNMQAPEKVVVKEVPTTRDVARHGAWKIYKLMGKHLNQSRKKCKSAFLEQLGFLMVPWSGSGVSVDQSKLTVRWGFPEVDASKSRGGRLQDIKNTKTKSSGDINLNEYNSNLLSELYGKRQDMILVVSHEVQVTEALGSSKRKRNRTKKRVINKAINVVEAAAKFCTEFAQSSDSERSPLSFLLGHKDALRCILGIALVFKDLTSQFLVKNCENGRVRDINNMDTTSIKCGNLRLSELIPGRSSQIRSLSGTVLRMKDNLYCKLNVGASPRNDGTEAGVNGVEGQRTRDTSAREIQPSVDGGVFAI